jgi:uncharacterized phiE125 gp8 family phage protein
MTKIRTIAPTVLAVTLADAKTSLRVDADMTDMDDLITSWIKGVVATAEHDIGQCLMEQTWQVRLDEFPGVSCHRLGDACSSTIPTALALPHPVISVTSVKYLDLDGIEQTLAPAGYKPIRRAYESFLVPARGASWPATAGELDSVVVTVVCGLGTDPALTPENVRLYLLAKLAEQFDPATRLERDTVQSSYLDGLLDACRCYA